MKIWKILHKPSGLWFCPSRTIKVHDVYVKSNLSKTGKVYTKRPSLNYLGGGVYSHLIPQNQIQNFSVWNSFFQPLIPSEWEIVEIQ